MEFPASLHKAYRVDYGPEFASAGIISRQPPEVGQAFPILVPQVNADGNETGGLRMPEIVVPLATYTGWNLYDINYGPVSEVAHMSGSYIPFATTAAEREANGDPRASILERYANRATYLGLVAEAAIDLIVDGYLLDADLPEILERAAQHWDYRIAAQDGRDDAQSEVDPCTIARMGKDCGF